MEIKFTQYKTCQFQIYHPALCKCLLLRSINAVCAARLPLLWKVPSCLALATGSGGFAPASIALLLVETLAGPSVWGLCVGSCSARCPQGSEGHGCQAVPRCRCRRVGGSHCSCTGGGNGEGRRRPSPEVSSGCVAQRSPELREQLGTRGKGCFLLPARLPDGGRNRAETVRWL